MKRILIVGGNTGIGFELAKMLLAEGVQVEQWSREEGSLSELGASFSTFESTADLPNLPDALDGVVYLPGTIRLKPFGRITDAEFIEDFQVNALGAARVLQKVYPLLKKSASPSVVMFSTVAVSTGLPFHTSISMAKAAVEGLTRTLAAEWAPHTRVNAIAPSLTDTPLANQLLGNDAKRDAVAGRHPLKKIGDPIELAKLAHFLLGSDSSFITGQIISADGGLGSLKI